MPRVMLVSPVNLTFTIDTMRGETLLNWFAEVLPIITEHCDITNPGEVPRIQVWPSNLASTRQFGQDWYADTRVIGSLYRFPYRDGPSAMKGLADLREQLGAEIRRLNAGRDRSGNDGH